MFSKSYISFEESGDLNPLVLDYIRKKEILKEFYSHYPDENGFGEIILQNKYARLNRKELVSIVNEQAHTVKNSTGSSLKNIQLLGSSKTFTVVTGHQLCLFTGPLYFIHKIISAINLAEELKKKISDSDFVPVYWMAGEDHDFEEVNHFHLFGKKITWQTDQKGAVGEFNTNGLEEVLKHLTEILGQARFAKELIRLFEDAYLRHNHLKSATRFLVNELFGKYGLVIVDGNDKRFKSQAKDIFRKDFFEGIPNKEVSKSISRLSETSYEAQVNPRPVNSFYLEKNTRARIERKEESFEALGTNIQFTKTELEKLLDEHPEKISPNVVLRPLYQQLILPNIAYIGGPGELAYWLEYRSMFDKMDIQFPVLFPRNFVSMADSKMNARKEKLNLEWKDFFMAENKLVQRLQEKSGKIFDTEEEKKQLENTFTALKNRISAIDVTLEASVLSELQKAQKSLENIQQKANRAMKQQSENEIRQASGIREKLFPGGLAQERFENFSSYYSEWGPDYIDALKNMIEPFKFEHLIILGS